MSIGHRKIDSYRSAGSCVIAVLGSVIVVFGHHEYAKWVTYLLPDWSLDNPTNVNFRKAALSPWKDLQLSLLKFRAEVT
jgi:hypothetical protein